MVFYYEDCLSFSSCICWFFSARVLLCCSMSICYCFFISSYKMLWSSSRRLYFSHFCRYCPNSSISPFCKLIWLARFLSFSHHKFYNYSIFSFGWTFERDKKYSCLTYFDYSFCVLILLGANYPHSNNGYVFNYCYLFCF